MLLKCCCLLFAFLLRPILTCNGCIFTFVVFGNIIHIAFCTCYVCYCFLFIRMLQKSPLTGKCIWTHELGMHDMKRRIVLVTELIITGHRRLFNLIVHQCLCKGDSGWNLKVNPRSVHWHYTLASSINVHQCSAVLHHISTELRLKRKSV